MLEPIRGPRHADVDRKHRSDSARATRPGGTRHTNRPAPQNKEAEQLRARFPATLCERLPRIRRHVAIAANVYEADLVGKLLAYLRVPETAVVGDLRDDELRRLGIAREQIASCSAEHYPCTRRLATQAMSTTHGGLDIQGLIWHSRQAELAGAPAAEVLVLFGSRYDPRLGSWELVEPAIRSLYDGPGRLLVDDIADGLDAVVESAV